MHTPNLNQSAGKTQELLSVCIVVPAVAVAVQVKELE
jgi:hypothetical protein